MTAVLTDLKNSTREEAVEALRALGEPRFRGDQVFRWIHGLGVEDFGAMTNITKALRERLGQALAVDRLGIDVVQVSRDGTRKLQLRTSDGKVIESVLIPDGDAGNDGDEDDATEAAGADT